MWRYHVQKALRAARISRFERDSARLGLALVLAAIVAAIAGVDAARVAGVCGLVAILACAVSRGARRYRAGASASMPGRSRPRRVFGAATCALALGLPVAAGVSAIVLVSWGWLVVEAVVLLGCVGIFTSWLREGRRGEEPWGQSSALANELLTRLCMRADMPVPQLVVTPGPLAIAWSEGGRIHVTRRLLKLLDDGELEAVLAHELAHLAHRDTAVLEICAAPSRVLLACADSLSRWTVRCLTSEALWFIPGGMWIQSCVAVPSMVCAPPAFVIGWLSRLSVLGMSRGREFAADTAAAELTRRPSALASALMKLEHQRGWAPRADLRQAEAYAVLCIIGTARSRLGRLFSTHPPTAVRVRRLAEMEERMQRGQR